jgi:hypothetical protein
MAPGAGSLNVTTAARRRADQPDASASRPAGIVRSTPRPPGTPARCLCQAPRSPGC